MPSSALNPQRVKQLFDVGGAPVRQFVVCLLCAIALMLLDHRYQRLAVLRGALDTVIYPLQQLVALPTLVSREVAESWRDHEALRVENQRLQRRLLLLEAQLQRLGALETENRRLRLLLKSAVPFRERALIAELIEVEVDPFRHRVLLNKGANDGVYVGQPLIDQYGVVGQIASVAPLTAQAILLTDPNHALSVQVNRNGLRTLAVGSGKYSALALPHIPNSDLEEIEVGDLLVTSGLDGRFPAGYPVAEVTTVAFDKASPFAYIRAKPVGQLERLREVLLIFQQSQTAETDASGADPAG